MFIITTFKALFKRVHVQSFLFHFPGYGVNWGGVNINIGMCGEWEAAGPRRPSDGYYFVFILWELRIDENVESALT